MKIKKILPIFVVLLLFLGLILHLNASSTSAQQDTVVSDIQSDIQEGEADVNSDPDAQAAQQEITQNETTDAQEVNNDGQFEQVDVNGTLSSDETTESTADINSETNQENVQPDNQQDLINDQNQETTPTSPSQEQTAQPQETQQPASTPEETTTPGETTIPSP